MSNCVECGVSLGRVVSATMLCNACEGSPQKTREREQRKEMEGRLSSIMSRLEALEQRQVDRDSEAKRCGDANG